MALIYEFIALVFFVSLVMPSHSADEDNREWLYKLLGSLRKHDQSVEQNVPNFGNGIGYNNYDLYETAPRDTQMHTNALRPMGRNSRGVINGRTDEKRFQWGGLLCCNHPPTRPPTTKRNGEDDKLKTLIMSKLMQSMIEENGWNSMENYQVDPSPATYWDSPRSSLDNSHAETLNGRPLGTDDDKFRMDRRTVTAFNRRHRKSVDSDEMA